MKKQYWLGLLLIVCVLVAGIQSAVIGAESMTVVNADGIYPKYVEFTWVTATDGDASGDATTAVFSGVPYAFVTYPSASAAPTASYDVTLLNSSGYDILANGGANRSATLVEIVAAAAVAPMSNTTLELRVANAGDSKGGIGRLYYR